VKYDNQLIEELMRLVAAEVEHQSNGDVLSERLLSWVAKDLRNGLSSAERARDEVAATAFAKRTLARIAARRAESSLPRRELRYQAAPVIASVSASMPEASKQRCATVLDLAVAAGSGRDLWDEPCEHWLKLPDDIEPSERYLALRVSGESMSPVLESRDVILIKLDGEPTIDDLVVARVGDEGYVVKRFAGARNGLIELSSFNPSYESRRVPRHRATFLGTVIARFKHE
jgi:SOS-response transcriptional repressor LexA